MSANYNQNIQQNDRKPNFVIYIELTAENICQYGAWVHISPLPFYLKSINVKFVLNFVLVCSELVITPFYNSTNSTLVVSRFACVQNSAINFPLGH